jgi:NAD-dependent protein deacetylase/lipoamidase
MGVERIREKLRASSYPVVLTGAGVSAESGVPVFRGASGLWRNFRAEDLATPEAFEADPFLVWEWYDWRRGGISRVSPNRAHYAIAELERTHPVTLITQNVDGLHKLAGSRNVLELHGSIWRVVCTECKSSSENREVPIKILPRCPCGGVLRPGVVWFGEALPEDVLDAAFTASGKADFMLVVGTSGVVQPAASLAHRARRAGAFLAEINIEPSALTRIMDEVVNGRASEVMPAVL